MRIDAKTGKFEVPVILSENTTEISVHIRNADKNYNKTFQIDLKLIKNNKLEFNISMQPEEELQNYMIMGGLGIIEHKSKTRIHNLKNIYHEKIILTICLLLTTFSLMSFNSNPTKKASKLEENTKIQVAILLDTSGSMDGLIEQAKSRLWNIVNTLTTLKYSGKTPTIEIALYEYGNDGIAAEKITSDKSHL